MNFTLNAKKEIDAVEKNDFRQRAELYLLCNPFECLGASSPIDNRYLARSIASEISKSKSSNEAKVEVKKFIDSNIRNEYDAAIYFNNASEYIDMPSHIIDFASEKIDLSRTISSNFLFESEIGSRNKMELLAEEIVSDFNLYDITIDGDAIMSSNEKIRCLNRLKSDLKELCSQIGVTKESIGFNGGVRVNIRSKQKQTITNENGLHLSLDESINGMTDVLSYDQRDDGQATLSHEFVHLIDSKLGRKISKSKKNGIYFSSLEEELQDKVPYAKEAIISIFSVLESDIKNSKESSINILNAKLVELIVGTENYFSMSTEQLKEISDPIKRNKIFTEVAGNIIKKTYDWQAGIYKILVDGSEFIDKGNNSRSINIIDTISSLLQIDSDKAAIRLFNSIGKLESDIKALSNHFTKMSRYISNPGTSLIASNQRNIDSLGMKISENSSPEYWTEPHEMLARIIGRGQSAWHSSKKIIESGFTQPQLSREQAKKVNSAIKTLAAAAGLKLNDEKNEIAIPGEALAIKARQNTMKAKLKYDGVASAAIKASERVLRTIRSARADKGGKKSRP